MSQHISQIGPYQTGHIQFKSLTIIYKGTRKAYFPMIKDYFI